MESTKTSTQGVNLRHEPLLSLLQGTSLRLPILPAHARSLASDSKGERTDHSIPKRVN